MARSFTFLFVGILFLASPLLCKDKTGEYLSKLAYFSQLVVEGDVQSIDVDSIQVFPTAVRQTWITNLYIAVQRVWTGFYDSSTIVVSVLGGVIPGRGRMYVGGHASGFHVGDRLLLLVYYDDQYNRYFTYDTSEFTLRGGKILFGNTVAFDDPNLFWGIINQAIRARSVDTFCRQADIVVRAKALEESNRETEFLVDEVFKGDIAGKRVKVITKRQAGEKGEIPWIQYGPKRFEIGSQYVLFLKESKGSYRGSYYAFAGANGVFQDADGELLSGGRRTGMSIRDFKARLRLDRSR